MTQRSNGFTVLTTAALISAVAATLHTADNDPSDLYYLMTNSTPAVLEDERNQEVFHHQR